MVNLFQLGNFKLHSGKLSCFRIICDALTDDDWGVLAYIIKESLIDFKEVIGVPTGGDKLAKELEKYRKKVADLTLVVDDVLTTGRSIKEIMDKVEGPVRGVVIFARNECPDGVASLFCMDYYSNKVLEFNMKPLG